MAAAGNVPRTVLGTMQFGVAANPARASTSVTSPELAGEILRTYKQRGFTELDTARMYQGGNTETFLCTLGLDGFDVASKSYPNARGGPDGFNETLIRRHLRESLEALRLPALDLFYLHYPDHVTPVEEALRTVDALYHEGKFRRFGISNYSVAQVREILQLCTANNWVKPVVYQGMYNIVTRAVEAELLPLLREHRIAFYAYNPLAGGLLTGRYTYEQQPDDGRFSVKTEWGVKYRERYWRKDMFDQLEAIKAVCAGQNLTLPQAALRWMYWHSALREDDAVILGASSMQQLEENLSAAAADRPLPAAVVEAIDTAWDLVKADCVPYYR